MYGIVYKNRKNRALIMKVKNILFKPIEWFVNGILFIVNNFVYGIMFICWSIYFIIKQFLLFITFPIRSLIKKSHSTDKYQEKKAAAEIKNQEKMLKNRMKQKEKERKYLAEQEKIAAKKRMRESDSVVFAELEKKSLGDKLNDSLENLLSIPKKIKESIRSKKKKENDRQILLLDFEGEDAIKTSEKQVYEYVAKDPDGKIVKDYFDAFSKVEVHSFLLNEGYEVYSIRTSRWIKLLHSNVSSNRTKIKIKDLIFFLSQLSTYIKAGIPLADSLQILSRQYKNKNYKRIFKTMMYDLNTGESFSSAMEKQGAAFPKLLINMIKTSEMTGELPEVLDDMESYYYESEATRRQMITALTYPSFIFVFALGVMTFIMYYVVPKFVDIYESMDSAKIPGITIFVLNLSAFIRSYLLYLLLGVIAFILIMKWLYDHVKKFRQMLQTFAMKLPVFGEIIIYNEVTMFTKTFASLLKHNVFITDSMEILNKITNNEIYKGMILDTISNLARGEKISLAFKDQWSFPIPAYEMIVTGERTGQLPEMMSKVSTYYQDQHRNSVARVKTFIEPFMIIFLAVGVGFILLAIIIPMFNMYSSIQ